MAIAVTAFDQRADLAVAAALLARRHARDRARIPFLPGAFEDPAVCSEQIVRAFDAPGWHGVTARAGTEVVAFAVMTPQLIAPTHFLASFFPPRGASIGYAAHAAAAGAEYGAYRAIYAALAEHFVALGFFDHAVSLPAPDLEMREAWASLGFGRAMTCAIRDATPVRRPPADGLALHMAGAEDADVVFALNEELTLHHARSPIFNPYIRESDPASHDFQRGLLADAEANAHWVAYDGGRPVGMNTFMQPFFLSPMTVPDKTVYLFQGIVAGDARAGGVGSAILARGVAWARERGYEHIALHFASANVPGANFWQSSGFQPIEHTMRRHIDERIAWADR